MNAHNETFLETACHQCMIRVSAWGDRDWKSIYISVFSEHLPLERWLWRGRNGRIRTAWRVLKQGWRDPGFEFDNAAELDLFLDALVKARTVAFGGSIGILRQQENSAAPGVSGDKP